MLTIKCGLRNWVTVAGALVAILSLLALCLCVWGQSFVGGWISSCTLAYGSLAVGLTTKWNLEFYRDYLEKFRTDKHCIRPLDPLQPCRLSGYELAKQTYEAENPHSA
jgi:hypothetical protein